MRIGAQEYFIIFHAGNETVEAVLLVAEERAGRDDELPAAAPDTAADEARAGDPLSIVLWKNADIVSPVSERGNLARSLPKP
jgi:hypothetical protein